MPRWWSRGPAQAAILWTATRLALIGYVLLASFLLNLPVGGRERGADHLVLSRFTWWDSFHFLRIADLGYLPPGVPCCDQAFFPGYPLAIRAVAPLTGGNVAFAGLLVSLAAATAAAVGLWRLGELATGSVAGGRAAVLFLAVAPYGFFLTAVYSEALFLAFAVGAWWAGTTRRWWLAGLLAGCATGVRINGLFLAGGLVVMYLLQLRADRRSGGRGLARPDAVALVAPLLALGGYAWHLHALTGSWNAWLEAQATGWDRRTAWPWEGLAAGWSSALGAASPDLVISRWADLAVAVYGIVLVAGLLGLRRWAEAVYVAPNVAVLVCSTTLVSGPRYAVMWFPAYLLLAVFVTRGPARDRAWPSGTVTWAVALTGVPLLAVVALSFAAHLWTA